MALPGLTMPPPYPTDPIPPWGIPRIVNLCFWGGLYGILESLGFAQNFLSSCDSEALHFIGIRSFGEEFREDVVFRGIQEEFRKPLA
jgi:hypothetical protein